MVGTSRAPSDVTTLAAGAPPPATSSRFLMVGVRRPISFRFDAEMASAGVDGAVPDT